MSVRDGISSEYHLSPEELEAGLDHLRAAPARRGGRRVDRPAPGGGGARGRRDGRAGPRGRSLRRLVAHARSLRPTPRKRKGADRHERPIDGAFVAGDRERWPFAGDQLYVDFDLSGEHLPPRDPARRRHGRDRGHRRPAHGLQEVQLPVFGLDALIFVNSEGRALNLRGINTRVVQAGGTVRVGDAIRRL